MSAYRYGWTPRKVPCPGSGNAPVGEPFEDDGMLKGFCPELTCGGVYAIRGDGTLRKHDMLKM
jgi:hypothetical protein